MKLAAEGSHYALYALMIGMPLIGWGMLSAAEYPVVFFRGWHLPAILPQSDSLHTLLWDAHFYLTFAFFALILLHVAAALFHALVRRDGVFETMASVLAYDGNRARRATSRAGVNEAPNATKLLRATRSMAEAGLRSVNPLRPKWTLRGVSRRGNPSRSASG